MQSRLPYDHSSLSPLPRRRNLRLLTIVVLPLLLLLACADATEVQEGESSVIPGVGSTFTTHILFSSDSIRLEDEVDVVVGAADMIVEGKERVVQYIADTLSSLLCYELNGDISVYMKKGTIAGCQVENTWLRFPFGPDEKVEEQLTVTRLDLLEGPKECLATWRAESIGEATVAVDGREYTTRKATAEFIVGGPASGEESDSTARSRRYEVWYAPEIGYVVREHIMSLSGPSASPDTLGTTRRELRKFVLR